MSISYANYYAIGPSATPGSLTVGSGAAAGGVPFSDADGDDQLEFNEEVYQFGNPTGFTYTGITVNGDPVISDGTNYLLLTNSSYAPGAEVAAAYDDTSSVTFCFCAGTLIGTIDGARTVETLSIGDQVLNSAGQPVTVKWIGTQRRDASFAALHGTLPVRISAGALGAGRPTRDLHVSPDHAMLVDGCLVHAIALVNGRTIEQARQWQGQVEYFHIETEAHELILAEGAAAETFIDNVSREQFDNHAEYAALYPTAAPMQELDLPRVCYARQLPKAISRRLDAVADELLGAVRVAA